MTAILRSLFMMFLLLITPTFVFADAIHTAASKGDLDEVRRLLRANPNLADVPDGNDRRTPLYCAVNGGHLPVVKFLLSQGVNINAKQSSGWTSLYISVKANDTDMALLLLSNGADPKFNNDVLHYAAKFANTVVIEKLLDCGAEINSIGREDETALYWAVYSWPGDKKISEAKRLVATRLLLAKGADLQIANKNRNTALHQAAEANYPTIVQFLIDNKVELNPRNKDGETPFTVASKKGFKEVMEILKRAGGTE